MITIITPTGDELELARGPDADSITEENRKDIIDTFKLIHLTEVCLSDGSTLIIPDGWRGNYAIRVYIDEEVTNEETHRLRHVELHAHLDELVADYIDHHNDEKLSETSVMHLIRWSCEQSIKSNEKE